MSHIEWVIAKALLLVLAAFIWGLFRGLIGRPLGRERSDTPGNAHESSQEP